MLFKVSVPPTLPISPCISVLLGSHFFSHQKRFQRDFLQLQQTNAEKEIKHSLSNNPITCVLLYQREKATVSQLPLANVMSKSNVSPQCTAISHSHEPISLLALKRQDLINLFISQSDLMKADSQFRFYSLFICKEDLISSLLSTHKVRVTMGTQSAPLFSVALRPVPLWRETTAVFTFGRQTGSLRAAMFVFVPDT